jgi:endonuclease YncB( thermonuclease family)
MKTISLAISMICCVCAFDAAAQPTALETARGVVASRQEVYDRRGTSMTMAGLRRVPGSADTAAFRKSVLSTLKEQAIAVDKVIDGDMFEAVVNGNRLLFRVAGIDAPEQGQENWRKSKDELERLISGKTVTVKFSTYFPRHVNGFFIVRVNEDKTDVGPYMLSNGWAWYDKTYGVFFSENEDAENAREMKQARDAKLGIWQNGKPEEPWKYFEKAEAEKADAAKKH